MLPTSLVTPLPAESCMAPGHAGSSRSASAEGGLGSLPGLDGFSELIHTIVLRGQQRKSVLCTLRGIVAKSIRCLAKAALLAMVLAAVPGLAQQPKAAAPDDTAQAPAQAAQQPLDLQEAVARDVLEPLQAGMESRDLKQVLSVFDEQTVPDYPQFRDQMKALLEAYAAVRFRYKILQASC